MEKKTLSEANTSRILRRLPREKAFYFFTSIGNYTGESADSLKEFSRKILDIDVKSLEFHLYRDDFGKWVAGTLEDNALAGKIKQLKSLKPIGIDLRDRLYLMVSKHYEELTKPRPAPASSTLPRSRTTTITFDSTRPQESAKTKA